MLYFLMFLPLTCRSFEILDPLRRETTPFLFVMVNFALIVEGVRCSELNSKRWSHWPKSGVRIPLCTRKLSQELNDTINRRGSVELLIMATQLVFRPVEWIRRRDSRDLRTSLPRMTRSNPERRDVLGTVWYLIKKRRMFWRSALKAMGCFRLMADRALRLKIKSSFGGRFGFEECLWLLMSKKDLS